MRLTTAPLVPQLPGGGTAPPPLPELSPAAPLLEPSPAAPLLELPPVPPPPVPPPLAEPSAAALDVSESTGLPPEPAPHAVASARERQGAPPRNRRDRTWDDDRLL
ncbi:hypothetical protein WME97_47270 [Sorangium sp. So ce367]|uniref:hypothetical protein n=1 Tax=Sorangium sp. So ce367 TaxID=3133305 RepID=UPI003F5E1701